MILTGEQFDLMSAYTLLKMQFREQYVYFLLDRLFFRHAQIGGELWQVPTDSVQVSFAELFHVVNQKIRQRDLRFSEVELAEILLIMDERSDIYFLWS
jgi:hypothetical protein